MGTSNFYYKNASKVFAINMSREVPVLDDEGNETDETETQHPEQWECQDTLDYIAEQMEGAEHNFNRVTGWNNDAPRSFPSTFIGKWWMEKSYAGVPIEVQIIATANSGYYEGACLDYDIKTFVSGNEYDEVDPCDLSYHGNINNGLAKIIAPKANKWIEETKEQLSNDLEKLFAEVCGIVLEKVATFSNGETVYKQVS